MKQFKLFILSIIFAASVTWAGSIKVWGSEVLKFSDLNANFAHIHNNMVGGHGARLVDSDVSPSAAIAHSKLATPALVPKAWAVVNSQCTADPCSLASSTNVLAVHWNGAGLYTLALTYTPTDSNYAVLVVPYQGVAGGNRSCTVTAINVVPGQSTFTCIAPSTNTASNSGFSILVMDDN